MRSNTGQFGNAEHSLGDVHGQVANTFQVRIDFEDGSDATEIDRDWLVEGEHLQAFFFNPVLALVDSFISRDDLSGERAVAAAQGTDGLVDGSFHHRRLAEDILLQDLQIVFEVFGHCRFSETTKKVRKKEAALQPEAEHDDKESDMAEPKHHQQAILSGVDQHPRRQPESKSPFQPE
jgi:hypothetical protein